MAVAAAASSTFCSYSSMSTTATAASVCNILLFFPNKLPTNFSSFSSSSSTLSAASFRTRNCKPFHRLLSISPPSLHLCNSSSIAAAAYDDAVVANEEEEEEEKGDGQEKEEVRRLYVGNLPYSMTSSQLADAFQEAGQVDAVEVIYDRVTDRSRGFAFVTMGSINGAKNAIRMFDGSQIGGRTVKVNFPEVPRGGEREVMGPKIRSSSRGYVDSPYKVYAGNLGWKLTSEGLKGAFESQAGFLGAKVIYERDSGRSRGFGFVTFSSPEEAQAAIGAMDGVEVEGRPLRLSLAEQRNTAQMAPQDTLEIQQDLVSTEMQSSAV